METMIGFIAGYLVGAKDGPFGPDRVRKSLEAIRRSPELRRLAAEGTGAAGSVLRQASRRGLASTIGEILKMLTPEPAGPRTSSTR
jgi:hypothetical protein